GSFTQPSHFHVAAKPSAIVNADARRQHAALHMAARSQSNAPARLQIALHRSVDHDVARVDVGGHAAIRANGDATVRQSYLTLRVAIDDEVGRAGDFAADLQTGADRRWSSIHKSRHVGR